MSFVAKNGKTKANFKSGKKVSKPDWDSTVNDLSEYRASPEEIARRQEAHRSKNLELVRKSAIEKRIAAARRQALSDSTNKPPGNAFLREILYSNGEAHQLLDDTTRALQVAHEVFRDDARKYKAVPAITAVNSDDEENAVYSRPTPADGLIKSANEPMTKLDKLSNSVMKKKALNETFSASSDSDSRHSTPEMIVPEPYKTAGYENGTPTAVYSSRVDLQRFQRLLDQQDLSTIASESSVPVAEDNSGGTDKLPHREPVLQRAGKPQATCTQTISSSKDDGQRKKTPKCSKVLPSAEATDLQTLLESLEVRLKLYESTYKTVGGDSSEINPSSTESSLSTFTVSLLSTLHRMMSYFTQLQETLTEERRQKTIREQQLLDLTNRTDLLTTELIQTQEQFHVVLDELNRVRTEQRHEIDTIKATLSRVCKGGTVHTVEVSQPHQSSIAATGPEAINSGGMVLRKSGSPTTHVTTYKEFEGSPEQIKILNSSQREQVDPDSGYTDTKAVETETAVDDPEMTLEQRIELLRCDHQETLERFKKLGTALHKENPLSTPNWLTDV